MINKYDEIKRQATFITNIPGLGYTEKQYRDSLTLLLKALELACELIASHFTDFEADREEWSDPDYWLEKAGECDDK